MSQDDVVTVTIWTVVWISFIIL